MEGFKKVGEATRPPGKCIASRDIEGPFIDTGNQITERGQVYISCRWLGEAAEEFLDMVPRSELEDEVEDLAGEVRSYSMRVIELEEALAAQEAIIKLASREVSV